MKTQTFLRVVCIAFLSGPGLIGNTPTAVAQTQKSAGIDRPVSMPPRSSRGLSYASKTAPDGSPIVPSVVQLVTDVDVPALETGLLKEILVKENQSVEFGQLLAKIDDRMSQRALEQAQFKHELANKRAEDPTDIQAAEEKLKLLASEYITNHNLGQKGSKTNQEVQRSKFSRDAALYELQGAKNTKELAAVEASAELVNVHAANDSIGRHKITSPVNGHVFKIYKEPGEWVNAGEKIMRIAPLSLLRVHGTVSAEDWDPYEIDGKKVTVSVKLAHGRIETFTGNVIQTELEQRGNTRYLVIAQIENRFEPDAQHWILQPQSRVEMTIHVKGATPSDEFENQRASQSPSSTPSTRNR